MQRLLVFFLAFVCATASAQVYRRIAPDGHVYFSDRPGPDAEPVEVTPNTAIRLPRATGPGEPPPEQADTTRQTDVATPAYSNFSIVSPTSSEGVRANNGDVTVVLKLVPELQPGHTILLRLDGEDGEQLSSGEDLTIRLTSLSRGLHTIEATVLDEDGNALIQAGPVSFNVLRVALGSQTR